MISVIIPVYNIERYLVQCLNSVIDQTFRDIEIILINDGSTDSSGKICDDYAGRDKRVKVIHQNNQGLSYARNVGTLKANGEWIFYLDSDDWLDSETLFRLHDFATNEGCDVGQCGFYYVYDKHMLLRRTKRKERNKTILDRNEAMRELIENDRVKNFAWGKLYKRDLIKDIQFPVGKFFEDSFWQHHVVHRVERYGIINEPLYYYRQRTDSISGQKSENLHHLAEGYEKRLEFIKECYPHFTEIMVKKNKEISYLLSEDSCKRGIITNNINKLWRYLVSHNRFIKITI